MQLILHFCAPNGKKNNLVHTRLARMMYSVFKKKAILLKSSASTACSNLNALTS